MSFEINSNVPKNLIKESLTNPESLAARKAALDLATHIEQRAEGSRFPGRLRVHNLKAALQGSDNPIEVKRANWFKNIFTSTNHVQKSSVYLRSLLSAAYKDKISPEVYEKVMVKVDKHLSKNLGFDGFGSRHFARFVREFESAPQIFKNAPTAKYYDAETKTLLTSKIIKGIGSDVKDYNQVISDIKAGLASMTSDNEGMVNKIAQGSEGVVFGLEVHNRERIIKINTNNAPGINDGLRKGDVAAAYFKDNNFNYIELPERFIIEVKKDDKNMQLYDVHRNELKKFIAEVKSIGDALGQTIDITMRGTSMDKVSGQPLSAISQDGALNDKDFVSLAVGLYCGLDEMRIRGLVHHDIKPANVIFNKQLGKAKMVDLGAMVKLSHKNDNLAKTNERMGTPPFQAPAAIQGKAHGAEVDRFSYAVTLLYTLEPKIASQDTISHLSSFFGGKKSFTNADGQPRTFAPSEYINEYLRALEVAHPEEAQALNEKLQGNPVFKEIIHQSFMASAEGRDGDLAWSVLRREAFPVCDLQNRDIRSLNSSLENKYRWDAANELGGVFSEIAGAKNFNYKLSDFNLDKLHIGISKVISDAAKINKDGVSKEKVITSEKIKSQVSELVAKFIDNKMSIFSAIDSKPVDVHLKSALKEQFNLDSGLKMEHVDKMLDVVPKVSSYLASFNANDVKNSYVNLLQLRKDIEGSLLGEGMDFQQSFLAATMRYASMNGVNMGEKLNALLSQQAQDFYSLLIPYGDVQSSALLDTIKDKGEKALIGRAADLDISFMNSLISNVSVGAKAGQVNIFDTIKPALKIESSDRDFILNNIYPV
jgi:serine/threonine protein kinase